MTFSSPGLELSFFSGVYSPSIGFTTTIGESAKQLVGLSGIFIGAGEVFGGISFGLMGARITNKIGRDPIVILGFVVHIIAFFLIFLNIPNLANFGDTSDVGKVTSSSFITKVSINQIVCFLLNSLFESTDGISCTALFIPARFWRRLFQHTNLFNARRCFQKTVHRSILDFQIHTSESQALLHSLTVHRHLASSPLSNNLIHFHVCFISQSVAAAMSFVYSTHLGLRVQMAILVVTGTIGTIAFYSVEWAERRKQAMKDEMIKSSDSTIMPS